MIDSDTITRSAAAPLMMRSRCANAVAKVTLSLLPLARSNSAPSVSTMDFTAPALRTLIVDMALLRDRHGRHSRPTDGVASLAYVPVTHVFLILRH